MKRTQLIALSVLVVLGLLVLAFVPPPSHLTTESATNQETLLGVFEGTLPCADCPGIQTKLTLTKDGPAIAEGNYELSLTYLERDVEPYVATGTWTTERGTTTNPDATVYALDPDLPDQTQRFLKTSTTTIRLVDREGNEIDPNLPFTLIQTAP